MRDTIVVDTNVLSSFERVGWLSGMDVWTPEKEVITSELVWEELLDYAEIDCPRWLSVVGVDLSEITTEYPGSLAPADWSCIQLTQTHTDSVLITNDRAMHDVADQRGVEFEWGTRFLLSTFKECGIEEGELDQGVDEYRQDLGLPESVVAEINDSSK